MHDETTFSLSSPNADVHPVLKGVDAAGRINGVLFELTLRQTYRNDSDQLLEVIYTFPLPSTAVVLGFATELNGERRVGAVIPRQQADLVYEEALEKGDAPVLLEVVRDGMHTANIGNLKPGDEIVLEVRFAQLLAFDQGRLRLAIPTAIAPRYGSAEQAGIVAHQEPVVSASASYPLTLTIEVSGSLATAAVAQPTHVFEQSMTDAGTVCLTLAPAAQLDRDVVLVFTPASARSPQLLLATDSTDAKYPEVAMVTLELPTAVERPHIALKVLVDCSGSMQGTSIASAREAVQGVLEHLRPGDVVSYSRFGSDVIHDVVPTAFNEAAKLAFNHHLNATSANLGGTAMEEALRSVLALALPEGSDSGPSSADVLLITDGEIWQSDELIAFARESGQRIFAIGVGYAPAESVLRNIAEATRGACEFATPGEQIGAAAQRMLVRARQEPLNDLRIDWGQDPAWEVKPRATPFGGDTLVAIAGFAHPVGSASVCLHSGNCWDVSTTMSDGSTFMGDALARIAAAQRVEQLGDTKPDAATALAVQYQLVSRFTHCVLVHEREDADRTVDDAKIHVVPGMVAHDWHGSAAFRSPSIMYSSRVRYGVEMSAVDAAPSYAMVDCMMAAPFWLRKVHIIVVKFLGNSAPGVTLDEAMQLLKLHKVVYRAIDRVSGLGITRENAWIALAAWISRQDSTIEDGIDEVMKRAEQLPFEASEKAQRVFNRLLAHEPPVRIRAPRVERLQTAFTSKC